MPVNAQPANSKDTICVPVPTYQGLVIAAEQRKILKEQISLLDQRILGLEEMIRQLNDRDSITVASYEAELKLMREQKALYEDQIATFEKLLRREKRKRFWTSVGGTLTTVGALFLFFTK